MVDEQMKMGLSFVFFFGCVGSLLLRAGFL